MREAELSDVQASGATFRGIDLSAANLRGADLTEADLRGSDLTGLDPLVTSLRGALIHWQQAVTLAEALGLDVRPE